MFAIENVVFSWEILVFVAVISFITWNWYSQQSLPPGPWGLPLVGYLPFLGNKPDQTFDRFGKKYGNIFSIRLGQRLMVVLNDYTAIKEAFVKQGAVFLARPPGFAMTTSDDEKGIFIDHGESYLKNRHFLIGTLREFGMGKSSLEPVIHEEIQKCLEIVEKSNGKPFDPHRTLSLMSTNIICAMTIGERFEYNDPKLDWLLYLPIQVSECAGLLAFRQFFPVFKHLPFGNIFAKQTNKLQEIKSVYRKFNMERIKAHENNPSEDIRDYIDAYLSQRNKNNGHSDDSFDLEYLVGTLEVLSMAGAETVASTLRWGLLYFTANPSVQTKVQAEIDAVIGTERLPSMIDQPKMNYTRATIMEINRMASFVPFGIARGNLEEVTLLGYRIPKGSFIVANLLAVHYDDKLWEDPTSFKPERFLDQNGMVKKTEYLVPFSIGKRSCVGESLGKMELFLILTSLLQRFTILQENYDPKTFEYQIGIGRLAAPFTIRVVQRKSSTFT